MRVLFAKDLRLLRIMMTTILIICGTLICALFMKQRETGEAVVGMLLLVIPLLGMSTMTYDEFDNGMEYLLTLPTSKKSYVIEKYIFTGIMIIGAGLVGMGVFVYLGDTVNKALFEVTLFVLLAILVLSINMPLRLKFGVEKSKIMNIITMGVVAVLLGPLEDSDLNEILTSPFVRNVMSLGKLQLGIGIGLIVVVILIISCCISIKISENKEY